MISFKEPQFIGTSLVIISTEEYRELLALIENLESFFAVETAKEEETEFIDVFFKKVEEYRKKRYQNCRKHPIDSEDLEEIITTPIPYGKYKGEMIANLPFNYLEWLSNNSFFNGKIGKLLAITFEIKKIDKSLL